MTSAAAKINENYQLVTRTKAAAGEENSQSDLLHILLLDMVLFSADVFTVIVNEINLYFGPNTNASVRMTEENNNDGKINKAHPIWGALTLITPFLPMLVFGPFVAVLVAKEGSLVDKKSCQRLGFVPLSILLCVPFSVVATPLYVIFVIGASLYRVCKPLSVEVGDSTYGIHGALKTAEISLESAIHTSLGNR